MIIIDLAGCCKSEYDRTYPIELNRIISEDEYIESIDKINRSFITNRGIILITLIFVLFIVIATAISFGFEKLVSPQTPTTGSNTVAAVTGCSLLLLIAIIIMIVLKIRRLTVLRIAVSEESEKYSSRSPIPCSWRLQRLSV